MVKYLSSFEGINDPVMEDGTTAFAMALARRDLALIGFFLASEHPSDIDMKKMAKRAILELDKAGTGNPYPNLRKELHEGLKKCNATPEKEQSLTRVLSNEWVGKIL